MKKNYVFAIWMAAVITVLTTFVFHFTQSGYKNLNRGLWHYNNGRYAPAALYFEKVRPENSQYTQALYYLAMSYNKTADKESLAKTLTKLTNIKSDIPQNIEWLGDTYYGLKQYDLSEKYYRAYLSNHSNNYTVKKKLAEVLMWQKKYTEAVAVLQTLERQRKQDYQIKELLADAYAWSNNYDSAINIYQELLEYSKNSVNKELVLKLAQTLRYAGKDSQAIELYNKYFSEKDSL